MFGLAVDSSGSAYVTGYTNSTDFPVTNGAYQTNSLAGQSAFVTKLNPAGTALSYSTYLGGSSSNYGNAIAVDPSGSAYVTGSTTSANFPVSAGAFQPNLGGIQNAFVAKLDPTGSSLAYSTYLGGSSSDSGNAIAVDAAGSAYIGGSVRSGNFPVTDGATIMEVASPNYYSTAFVASLNPSGTALQYSTYFGGTTINGIASRPGSVSVVGTTSAPNLIGASLGFQKTLASGATNAFVAKLSDPPAGCSYVVSPTTFSLAANGASGTVNVTAGLGCPWLASPNSSGAVQFNPLSGVTGSGPGSVNFTLASNIYTYSAGRTLMFTVAGRLVSIVQAGGCAISLASSAATHGPGAIPSASIGVNGGSCNWSTFTTAPWITLPYPYCCGNGNGYSSYGNGTINYKLLPNPGGTRSGTIYVGPLAFTVTQLGAGSNQATLTSPAPGTALPDTVVTFNWTPIAGASQYTLAVGSGPSQSNYCLVTTAGTSTTCSNLPADGSLVYATLTSILTVGGAQTPVSYAYTAATASLAQLLNPAPVSAYPGPATTVLPGPQTTFSWSRGIGADNYWLDVGTAYLSGNICSGPTALTSSTCSSIPCSGGTINVQLWTHYPATGWQTPKNYVYQACTATLATVTSPTPGTTLTGSTVTFKWAPGTGADNYWLDVGTSVGQGNICSGATTVTQSTCNNIPTNGVPIYVQLYTHVNGTWQGPPSAAYRYSYAAAQMNTRAQLTSPANNASLPGSSTTFTWNAVAGADQYWLDVGNTIGQGDICATSTAGTQFTCNNIPVTYLMTTQFGGGQLLLPARSAGLDGRFTPNSGRTSPGTGWQAPVRISLAPPSADFWLDVGTSPGQGNISAGVVSGACKTVAIPAIQGNIYVQIWTRTPAGMGGWYGPVQYSYLHP